MICGKSLACQEYSPMSTRPGGGAGQRPLGGYKLAYRVNIYYTLTLNDSLGFQPQSILAWPKIFDYYAPKQLFM